MRRLLAIVTAWAVLLVVSSSAASSAAPESPTLPSESPTFPLGLAVSVTVDGEEEVVSEGEVVAQGSENAQGECTYGSLRIGVSAPQDLGRESEAAVEFDVTISPDKDCTLSVENISVAETSPPLGPASESVAASESDLAVGGAMPDEEPESGHPIPPNPPPSAPSVYHAGVSRAVVQEQFGLTASETETGMAYTRRGDRVFDGRDPSFDEYNSHAPCWSHDNLRWVWWPEGPGYVYIQRKTRWWNCTAPRPDYTLRAKFWADPGVGWDCWMTNGSLPPFWDLRCRGGLFY